MAAQHASASPRLRRRSRPVRVAAERYTVRDVVAVALIMVAVVVLAAVTWVTGGRSHAILARGGQVQSGAPITREPTGLVVAWRAPSPVTATRLVRGPLTAGPVVLTGTFEAVTARSPMTGEMVWEYRRGIPLCALEAAWGGAVTVWDFPGGCGDVMLIKGDGGRYGPSRSGFAAGPRRIVTGGQHVLSYGPHQVESWRADLVRTMLVGPSETPLEPDQAQRTVCDVVDATENDDTVGVLRRCPGDASLRFTFFNAVPKEDVTPELEGSWLTGAHHGAVLEVTDSRALLYLAEPTPRFVVLRHSRREGADEAARTTVRVLAMTRAEHGRAALPGIPIVRTDKSLFWNDGENLYAFDAETLVPKWSAAHVVGTPGILSSLMGSPHWLVAPVRGGLALLDGNTGKQARLLPVAGPAIRKVVVIGGMIVVQQGDTILGLSPLWDVH